MPNLDVVSEHLRCIAEATDQLSTWLGSAKPTIGFMTGTGLASIIDDITVIRTLPYTEIAHFPASTVQSHTGQLVLAEHMGTPVLVLAGRWHYYEGYSTKEMTLPIRVLSRLGIGTMIMTNVAGGVNPHFEAGDIVSVTDHINTIPDHPLRGQHDEQLGVRFPDMMRTYDPQLLELVQSAAIKLDISIQQGIYYALQGPSLETPAEYKMIHRLGADLVGMSTVPEVIVARHVGIRVAVLSIVSNVCYPQHRLTETTIEDVIQTAKTASVKLNKLVLDILNQTSTK